MCNVTRVFQKVIKQPALLRWYQVVCFPPTVKKQQEQVEATRISLDRITHETDRDNTRQTRMMYTFSYTQSGDVKVIQTMIVTDLYILLTRQGN